MAQNTQATQDLDTTINALQGGLTALSPATAVSNIESWQGQLEGSNDSGLQQIAADLGELKGLLSSGNLNGQAIGAILVRLGNGTTQAAASAPAGVGSRLATLGGLLTSAGSALS